MSFLAIGTVDEDGLLPQLNLGQLLSYISLIFNISTIASCAALSRLHRTASSPGLFASSLRPKGYIHEEQKGPQFQRLAFILSMPHMFFWWGYV